MTKKRFENRLNRNIKKFTALNPVWDNEKEDALNVFEMIDELNELHEENTKLDSENTNLIIDNKELKCTNIELAKKNEQLKQSNKDAWNLIRFIYNEIKEEGSMDWWRIQDLVEF